MKKVLKVIVNIFAWLIVFLALLVTILVFSSTRSNGVANLLGYIPLTVESQSMSPTFEQGDLIICKQIDDPSTLQVNDVITFWTIIDGQKVKNTHRIVEISDEGSVRSFTTRGDHNPIADEEPTYPGDLIGKWTDIKLSGAGNIMAFLRTKVGFFVCILIPMAIFFLIELYKFIVTLIEVKRPATEPALDEEEIKRRAIEEYLAAQKEKEAEAAKSAEKPTEEAAPAAKQEDAPAEKPAEEAAPAAKQEDAPAATTITAENTAPAENSEADASAPDTSAADDSETAAKEH